MELSVCILTKNSEATLPHTLGSLKPFSEVLLLDTGSTDKTLEMARGFLNLSIYKAPFTGFGPLRNQAADLAKHDWILALDSDEVLSNELQEELQQLKLDPNAIYEIPFHNYYNGKRIRGCGWDPESHIRLYNRKNTSFTNAAVHEGVQTKKLKIIPLKSPIRHTPYRNTSDFLRKMQHYSDLFANERKGRQKSSFSKALLHGFGAFCKSYLLKRGCLIGKEGFIISVYNANTAFYKYLKPSEC